MEIFESSPSHVSTWSKLYVFDIPQCDKHQRLLPLMDMDGDEIVKPPLSCYIVKERNRKVHITGLVQLSNLTNSYDGNKSGYNGK